MLNFFALTTPTRWLGITLACCLWSYHVPVLAHAPAPVSSIPADAPVSVQSADISSAQFDADGRLWVVWAQGEFIYVSSSDDLGKSFSPAVKVNHQAQKLKHNGESRPLLALGPQGQIYVVWAEALSKRFSGHVRFSRSLDGGKRFEPSQIVNDNLDEIGHSFAEMKLDQQGHIHLFWLDSRDAVAAKSNNKPYTGSALYYAVSTNQGASFEPNRKLADGTCQCCRLAVALDQKQPVVMWRHIFADGSRDHGLLSLGESQVQRISFESWKVESCPHHGPSLTIDSQGRYHFTWFNQHQNKAGLYYAWSDDQGKTLSPAVRFAGENQAQHPTLLSVGKRLYRSWKVFNGQQTEVLQQYSDDQGQHWSAASTLASSQGQNDHPQLIRRGEQAFLAWQSQPEGFRLIALP